MLFDKDVYVMSKKGYIVVPIYKFEHTSINLILKRLSRQSQNTTKGALLFFCLLFSRKFVVFREKPFFFLTSAAQCIRFIFIHLSKLIVIPTPFLQQAMHLHLTKEEMLLRHHRHCKGLINSLRRPHKRPNSGLPWEAI